MTHYLYAYYPLTHLSIRKLQMQLQAQNQQLKNEISIRKKALLTCREDYTVIGFEPHWKNKFESNLYNSMIKFPKSVYNYKDYLLMKGLDRHIELID